jgi:hypothetical protein
MVYFDKLYELNLCEILTCYFWALCKLIVQDLYLIFNFVQFGCNKKKNEGILEKDLFDIFRWFMKGMCQKNQLNHENMLGFLPQLKAKIKYILSVVQALYLSCSVQMKWSRFSKVKWWFNFSKTICKKLLDVIEYKNE